MPGMFVIATETPHTGHTASVRDVLGNVVHTPNLLPGIDLVRVDGSVQRIVVAQHR